MKQLLGMAREKKKDEEIFPIKKMAMPEPEEEEYNEEQVFEFAKFLGIQLPEEEDLLYIAEEALNAELPADWDEFEDEDGEIVYLNRRTGQQTTEHPCDEQYRQLIIQERKKKQNQNRKTSVAAVPYLNKLMPTPAMSKLNDQSAKMDPLLKSQMEKEQKRYEELKKAENNAKKSEIEQQFRQKKKILEEELRAKEIETQARFDEEQKKERETQQIRFSEQEKAESIRHKTKLDELEQRIRKENEEILAKEKQKDEAKYLKLKEEIAKKAAEELKLLKRNVDEQFSSKLVDLETREKELRKEVDSLSEEEELKKYKAELVKLKMKSQTEILKKAQEALRATYIQKLKELQDSHALKVKDLHRNVGKSDYQSVAIQSVIQEVEKEEREQLTLVQFEIESLRKIKESETNEKLEILKRELQIQHNEAANRLIAETEQLIALYESNKQSEYKTKLSEAEKKAKESYIRAVKNIESNFHKEEELVHKEEIGTKNSVNNNFMEKIGLESVENILNQLNREENQLRKQIQNIKSKCNQIQISLESGLPIYSLNLTENQFKIYELVKNNIRNSTK